MTAARKTERDKISAEFAARLEQIPADRPCKSIVLLETGAQPGEPEPPARTRRKAAVDAVKASAQAALKVVDEVLERTGGRRLSEAPDALGSIHVEVTPEGLFRLAHLKEVRAVLDDQNVFKLPTPKT